MAKEYEIPDFPGYTIDEDKKVYSYKKGYILIFKVLLLQYTAKAHQPRRGWQPHPGLSEWSLCRQGRCPYGSWVMK